MTHRVTRCVASFCAAFVLAACSAAREAPALDGSPQATDAVPADAFASATLQGTMRAVTPYNVTKEHAVGRHGAESENVAVTLPVASPAEVVGCPPVGCPTELIPSNDCKLLGGAGEPFGATSDRFGNIWVADHSGQRAYACNPRRRITRILSDPEAVPIDVSVARNGTVAVTNYTTSVSRPGDVAFYVSGSHTVTSTVSGLLTNFMFGAFDAAGNFYDDGFASGGAVKVGIIYAGSTYNADTGISGIGYPGGIMIAHNGTINVLDEKCRCIGIFRGSNRIGTVTLGGSSNPISFAFDRNDAHVWVADYAAGVLQYAYPAGGAVLTRYTPRGSAYGIAVIPVSDR
jgi:hypothetical protein